MGIDAVRCQCRGEFILWNSLLFSMGCAGTGDLFNGTVTFRRMYPSFFKDINEF